MNDTSISLENEQKKQERTPQLRQEEQQISKLVLEEVISQRNTLMNEMASLTVQLKVLRARCDFLELEMRKKDSKDQTTGEQ